MIFVSYDTKKRGCLQGRQPFAHPRRQPPRALIRSATATATVVAADKYDRYYKDPYPIIVDEIAKTVVVHKYNLSFQDFERLLTASISYYAEDREMLTA